MRALYVQLPEPARDALLQLALREYRHPRDQAAVLLLDGLRRAGLLTREAKRGAQREVVDATER